MSVIILNLHEIIFTWLFSKDKLSDNFFLQVISDAYNSLACL
jgi:hypothetical protein